MWTFDKITGHRKITDKYWEVKVIWYTGEDTWELMHKIKEYDRLTLAVYARDNKIFNTPKWK